MSELEFSFEPTPWERALETLTPGQAMSAAAILTLLEDASDEEVEDSFRDLLDRGISIDLSDLPGTGDGGQAAVRLRRERQLAAGNALERELEDTDPLRVYLEEIRDLPACSDDPTQDRLNRCLKKIAETAKTMTGRGVLLLDLMQEGALGLWEAVDGGETDEDALLWHARQAMAKAVLLQARAGGVGQKMRQAAEDYRAVDERLLTELGRNPTTEEMAEGLHLSPEETEAVAKTLENARLVARARETGQMPKEQEESQAAEEEQAVEDTAYFHSRQRIAELLADLPEQDARLLGLRFGLEGGLPLSPAETGEKLGLTPEEVVAREAAALGKIRRNNG